MQTYRPPPIFIHIEIKMYYTLELHFWMGLVETVVEIC